MPDNKFPEAYQKISQALFDEFDAIDWGAPIEPKGSKNQRPIGSSETGTPRSAKPKVAPIDHPIYGLNGPMHHIQQCQGDWEGAKRYYMLDSSFPPKDWKVFGHNGLTVGQCWPLLVAAYRDGAHGKWSSSLYQKRKLLTITIKENELPESLVLWQMGVTASSFPGARIATRTKILEIGFATQIARPILQLTQHRTERTNSREHW